MKPGAYARWMARHLKTSVSAAARHAGVDLRDWHKVCRGVPKIVSTERMRSVYGVHRLTPAQFEWNVKIGWDWRRSFAPGQRGTTTASAGSGNCQDRSTSFPPHRSQSTVPGPLEWVCRSDICRLAGRCAAAKHGDFSGRKSRACVEMPVERANITKRRTWSRSRQVTQPRLGIEPRRSRNPSCAPGLASV